MGDNFAYDAPQFVDFETIALGMEDTEKIESYFDIDHENENKELENQLFFTPSAKTPAPNKKKVNGVKNLRKSLSTTCLPQAVPSVKQEDVDNISNKMRKTWVTANKSLSNKSLHIIGSGGATSTSSLNKYPLRHRSSSVSKMQTRSRSNSRDNILAQPKYNKQSNSDLNKYVTMAEAINKFQLATPTRFHSRPKSDLLVLAKCKGPLQSTVPYSPALSTKNRHRPTTVISREQQEILDIEEAQKYKIKAKPVNAKILQGPIQPKIPVERKAPTVFEPFNITLVQPKKIEQSPKKEVIEFHAKPVPKSLYEPQKPVLKPVMQIITCTPKFVRKYNERKEALKPLKANVENHAPPAPTLPVKLTKTFPVPFSFEKRDECISKRKEKLIAQVMDDEKRAREFHARPMPKSTFASPETKPKLRQRQNSMESIKSNKSDEIRSTTSEPPVFKARPAKVLYMKPFEPKKDERTLIEIKEFQLNSNRRAKERTEFDKKIKEKEALVAAQLKMAEEDKIRRELDELARVRKDITHKAQPIRHFKEMKMVESKKLTEPITPKLTKRRQNKENDSPERKE